jgi:ABC-type lipoprotein export system ATPase subunit
VIQKNDLSSRGSEWRKWDLQVHTPASHLNNQFGDDWDAYVQALFRAAIAKTLAVIALTDYFTIDGYKKVRQDYLENPLKLAALFTQQEIARIKEIRLLPNVEFRLNKFVGPNRINCHVILSDEVDIKDIEENFLHDLTFIHEAEPQEPAERMKLKSDNLRRLGERLIREHEPFRGQSAIVIGMKNAVVDDDEILKVLKDKRFKEKYLFCMVADEDLSKIPWNSQDHLTRKVLVQRSDALYSSNPSTRTWALGRPPQYKDGESAFIAEFKSLKPCINGSDCHQSSEIGHPCAKRGEKGHTCAGRPGVCDLRYCWIKADTTFEGLRQIIHEPADRVFIGPSAPEYHDEARVIASVTLKDGNGWFDDIEIPLNPGMVSIIGQKGSGKSALADLIAFAAGSWGREDVGSFLCRAEDHLSGMSITLNWADQRTSAGIVGEPKEPDNEVHYLSQNYVERICAKDGISKELVREIENVIFHYLDPTDTLNAADFDDLRTMKTESIREESNRLRDEIDSIIRDECDLRDQKAKLPERNARAKTLREEREGLTKQIPKPASLEEKKTQDELQQKRSLLAKRQQEAATQKQNLQRVSDVRARINAFKVQMQAFYTQVQPILQAIGIPQSEWKQFLPTFADDTEQPLVARQQAITTLIQQIDGTEPPAIGTIKKLQAEIGVLMKVETADKARQERTKQIQTRIAVINTELDRLDAEIKQITEGGREKLLQLVAQRLNTYVDYFKNLQLEQRALLGLYEPIQEKLSEQALLKGKELAFSIRWAVDLSLWLERGAALFDQRRTLPYGTFEKLSEAARKILQPAWASGDPDKIKGAFETFMSEFRQPELPWKSFMRGGVTERDILKWVYEVDHISLEYGLKFNDAELENLSPGTKGIVLLILYLGMDTEDSRPLVVDQPDENLDNESIYNLLTPYFRAAKSRRQIIVITHNPNLVVNSDSEQIIIASAEKQANGLPVISYQSGSLENNSPPLSGVRQKVCRILEGGDTAFLKRERRYAIQE